MNKIYQFVVVFVLMCNIETIDAQKTSNHLMPVGGNYDVYDYSFEYSSKVRKVLFNGLTDRPEIRFQVMPSFTPENVLDIEHDRDSNRYYIIYHICEQMIWSNKNWEKVKVNRFKSEIDHESVKLIKSLFETATAQTRYPERTFGPDGSEIITVGFDGENYYFSVFISGYGIRSGTVWSPTKGTKMEKLVAIGNKLIELAKSEKEMVTIDRDLRKSIENLINELK
ncbi:MAG: hypothetical protein LBQ60_15570 [Bacteroidales bacterium]|jgi:hypothetical protein|nr:hypothetical protein [Bacteroidales bacterium]